MGKKTPYYHNIRFFFTQDKSILKCSYVLKGTIYGKIWHQINVMTFISWGFWPVKLQNSIQT